MSDELKLDPLYTIFEKHLYDFHDDEENSVEFINKIVNDYMTFLSMRKVTMPKRWQNMIVEELRDQVMKMMVKKMYGCLSIQEFVLNQKTQKDFAVKRKVIRKKYSKLY
jgi:hypothetical protein